MIVYGFSFQKTGLRMYKCRAPYADEHDKFLISNELRCYGISFDISDKIAYCHIVISFHTDIDEQMAIMHLECGDI